MKKNLSAYFKKIFTLGFFTVIIAFIFFTSGLKTVFSDSGVFYFGGPFPITETYSGTTPGVCENASANPTYSIDAENTTNDHYIIGHAAFHSDVAGCTAYSVDPANGIGWSFSGQNDFPAHASGHFDLHYATSSYNCGRVQYDEGYVDTDTGDITVFIGQVINYGVDCSSSGVMSGTLTPASSSCQIAAGQNSCSVTLSWSITNPEGATTAITSGGMSDMNVTGSSGNVSVNVPQGSRTFYLYNNAKSLASVSPNGAGVNATSSCEAGSIWNGSICLASAGAVDGMCASSHWSCNLGSSANNAGSGSGPWTWNCNGSNGGSNASCSEGGGPVINGACSSSHYNCSSGSSANNVSGTTDWSWSCNGSGGGSDVACSEGKPIDCVWGGYGACSVSACGWTGIQNRSIVIPAQNGGAACVGLPTQSCSMPLCTVNFSGPDNIWTGDSATLTWSSPDATQCTGTFFNTNENVNGSVIVSPISTTTYSISCSSGATPTVKTWTVVVKKKPIIIEN